MKFLPVFLFYKLIDSTYTLFLNVSAGWGIADTVDEYTGTTLQSKLKFIKVIEIKLRLIVQYSQLKKIFSYHY